MRASCCLYAIILDKLGKLPVQKCLLHRSLEKCECLFLLREMVVKPGLWNWADLCLTCSTTAE